MQQMLGTTIVAVKKDGKCAVAGDGQVTFGENTIMKHTAKRCAGYITTALLRALPVRWRMRFHSLKDLKLSLKIQRQPKARGGIAGAGMAHG